MADDIDRANDMAEAERQRGIQSLQARTRHTSRSHCADCGAPIPVARQAAYPGATRCIYCQEIFEK